MSYVPLNTAGLNALPRELGSHGSAVNNTFRQLAGAIGIAVVMTIFSIQSTAHATALASQQDIHENMRQLSSILSTNDAYLVMLVFSIVRLVVACFMPRLKKIQ